MSAAGRAAAPRVALTRDDALDDAERSALAAAGLAVTPAADAASAEVVVTRLTAVGKAELAAIGALPESWDAPLVVVLETPPTPYAARVLHTRVEGAVPAGEPQALVATVRAVLAGQSAHPLAWRAMLARPLLSTREKQVLAMVVLGLTNGEIAAKLHVTEGNVKFHLTSSFRKLGVRSRDEASALILDPDAGLGPGILRILPEGDGPAAGHR